MSFERSYCTESHEKIKQILIFGDKSLLLTCWVTYGLQSYHGQNPRYICDLFHKPSSFSVSLKYLCFRSRFVLFIPRPETLQTLTINFFVSTCWPELSKI